MATTQGCSGAGPGGWYRGEPRGRTLQMVCLGNPDPVGMKFHCTVGKETFDGETTEEARLGGKLVKSSQKRAAVAELQTRLGISERRACTVVDQLRRSQRFEAKAHTARRRS